MIKTKISTSVTAIIAAAAVMAAFGVPRAYAAENMPAATGCTLATLTGGYGASLTGVQVTGTGNVNVAVVGRLVADGAGNITSMNGTVSLAGIIVPASGSGTYTLGPVCTGTATLNTSVIPTVHITFTMVSQRTRALAIGTDAGYVVTGEIDKQ